MAVSNFMVWHSRFYCISLPTFTLCFNVPFCRFVETINRCQFSYWPYKTQSPLHSSQHPNKNNATNKISPTGTTLVFYEYSWHLNKSTIYWCTVSWKEIDFKRESCKNSDFSVESIVPSIETTCRGAKTISKFQKRCLLPVKNWTP